MNGLTYSKDGKYIKCGRAHGDGIYLGEIPTASGFNFHVNNPIKKGVGVNKKKKGDKELPPDNSAELYCKIKKSKYYEQCKILHCKYYFEEKNWFHNHYCTVIPDPNNVMIEKLIIIPGPRKINGI